MKRAGFTLIELLVSITLLVLMVGYGLASFSSFNRRERLKQTALTLKSKLRFAQAKAISSEKPSAGCTVFSGMQMSFDTGSYTTQHFCAPQGVVGTGEATTFPTGVSFSTVPSAFLFQTQGSTSLTADLSMTLTNGVNSYIVVVSPNGNISDLGMQ